MKITIKQYVLVALMEKAFGVTTRNNAITALQSIKVEARDGLTLIGSDGELTMIANTQQVVIEEPDTVAWPIKALDIVRAAPDGEMAFEIEDGLCKITTEATRWEIRLPTIDDFPQIETKHRKPYVVNREEFESALKRVRPAIASDNIRANYMFVQAKDGVLQATDGSKMLRVAFPGVRDVLFPSKAVEQVLRRIRTMASDEIEIGETKKAVSFKFDDDILVAAKHTTEYPDLQRALITPTAKFTDELRMDVKALSSAVARVALTADDDTNFLTMVLSKDTLTLTTLDKNGNEAEETLDVYWKGEDRELGVNHNYLADVLEAIESNECRMLIGEDKGARRTMLRFEEAEEEGFLGVLVQLRPDLGEAAKGSDVVRPQREAPAGWEEPKRKKRRRKKVGTLNE